jgi:hypothetical protein
MIIVYRTSKREELLYAMKRDQEGRQHQGLRKVFKPLKEWYGKTDNHSGRHFGGCHVFGPVGGAELVKKTHPKTFF